LSRHYFGFSNNRAQIVTIIRRYVKYNTCTTTSKVKITLRGQRLTESVILYILCPVHNVFINQGILKIIGKHSQNDIMIRWYVMRSTCVSTSEVKVTHKDLSGIFCFQSTIF
jgi:hypothetical protein